MRPVKVAGRRPRALLAVLGVLTFVFLTPHLPFSLPNAARKPQGRSYYEAVANASRPLDAGVIHVPLPHLDEPRIREAGFAPFWISSAWLDPRPLIVEAAPEVTIFGVGPREMVEALEGGMKGDETPLWCYILVKQPGVADATRLVSRAYFSVMPDVHIETSTFASVKVTCSLITPIGEVVPSDVAEVFVTLITQSKSNLLSPHRLLDAFKRVQPLPRVDPVQHARGIGSAAVCLQPMTGDIYAPSMRDYVSYYRALGFTDFYAYLLDPGPEALVILRELAQEPGFHPVRWTIPNEWNEKRQPYHVNPNSWAIPELAVLTNNEEDAHSSGTKAAVTLRDYGQNIHQHDCHFRAILDGNRWVAPVDWDEYVVLRPPSGHWPPPSRGHPKSSVGDWAATFDLRATQGLLPSALVLNSAFVCILCQPRNTFPAPDPRLSSLDLRNPTPAIPSIFVSAVRHTWLAPTERSKMILDPWAWSLVDFHKPKQSYAYYALARAEAWGIGKTGVEVRDAYTAFMRLQTSLVGLIPEPNLSQRTNVTNYGTGAMFHVRADQFGRIGRAVAAWAEVVDLTHGDRYRDQRGSDLLSQVRVSEELWSQYSGVKLQSPMVEDWSVLEVMSGALGDMIAERRVSPLGRGSGKRRIVGLQLD
ncbi:hypothetical protein RQP46_010179 [Phenoliferia psychrophenolica]